MAIFRCPSCGNDCCTCSGCSAMFTTKGTQCCSRCYTGVQRSEDAQATIQAVPQNIQQNRPNEKLYING